MMFKTYLITSLRALAKNKLISIINIMGLSVGLSCALLVFLFVQYEVDVDQFHQKIDSIYRSVAEFAAIASNTPHIVLQDI